MKAAGIATAFCVNPAVGSVPLDLRCRGLADVLGEGNAKSSRRPSTTGPPRRTG